MTIRRFCSFVLGLAVGLAAAAQEPPEGRPGEPARAEVLVLGVFHMANPGRDVVNMQVDDVLAPKRQAEIAKLIEVLKRFRPTKVAVEAELGSSKVPEAYAAYLAGERELTRNETEQIGFRLAKELGHEVVHPVDADGDFPWMHVVNFAAAKGRSAEFDAMTAELGERVAEMDAYLASHTVLETLLWANDGERVAEDVGFYYRLIRFGEPWDWAGADLIAEWSRRNLRIHANLVQLVDSPDERIVVIFGLGHLGWLRRDIEANPELRLRELSELVP